MSKISVIMAVFNREECVARAIESILNQTYKEFEFIIVDDGSIDKSPDIIKKYAKKDQRIKVISQQNSGLAQARNTGVSNSCGEYIAFMDDDDISVPKRLEKQLNFLEHNHKFSACVSLLEFIDHNEKNIGYEIPSADQLPSNNIFLKNAFVSPFIINASAMIRKKDFITCSGFRTTSKIIEDLDLTLRFEEKFSVAIYGEYLYRYTRYDSNSDHNLSHKNPVHKMKSYIATYVSAWYRRNNKEDPIESDEPLDKIMDLIPNLPQVTRESIYRRWVPGWSRVIKTKKNISIAELLSIVKIIKHIAHENLAVKLINRIKKGQILIAIYNIQFRKAINILRINN